MNILSKWWRNDLPIGVKFVFFVLLLNGLPAFLILMLLPRYTDILFVWTINPVINARLIGVMYSNALLLVVFGVFQPSWPRARVIMVVITLFSVFATLLTFFFLKPFLAHPWYHLAYWLTMYFVLFFSAPFFFFRFERKFGGRIPVQAPVNVGAKLLLGVSLLISLVCSLLLIFNVDAVNRALPWELPPLVAALIGVLFFTHAAAYAWALFDGDWVRVRPIFWQAPLTAAAFALLPLVHFGDLKPGAYGPLIFYLLGAALFGALFTIAILSHLGTGKQAAVQS